MPNSKYLTRGISNLVSLITKTKLGLSLREHDIPDGETIKEHTIKVLAFGPSR
jgi:hypothetical protein